MNTPTPAAPTVAGLNTDIPELGAMLDRLSASFHTLSTFLLAPPSQALLDQVRTPEMLQDWPSKDCSSRTEGIGQLLASKEKQEDETTIRHDFNALFVGPERMKAAPYESVHLSQENLVFEQQTFVVRAAYAEFDLAAPKLNQEPDDHIGLELAFLSTLGQKALDSLDVIATLSDKGLSSDQTTPEVQAEVANLNKVLSAMHSFLEQHLLQFGPTFFTLLQDHGATEFYRGVGSLGLGVLEDAGASFSL